MTPNDSLAWGVVWSEHERATRQRALGIETHDERLEQREVLFVERFLATGNQLEWIPQDTSAYKPTHDFRWLNHGAREFELKCNKARLKTITAALSQSIYKAKRQGVVKENFMVCVGDVRIEQTLRFDLRMVNEGRTERVAELWVLSATGLERVPLAQ